MNQRYGENVEGFSCGKRPKTYGCTQMTFKRMMSLIAMAFLWTGSQIPVYIFGMALYIVYYPVHS